MEKKFGKEGLFELVSKEKIAICAHRGTCGGNVVQNTVLAAKTAMLHGADIFEVDALLSKDGVFFGFHDGHEIDVLHIERSMKEMTSKEIEELYTYNSLNLITQQKVERLDYIFEKLKGECFINVDRSWVYGAEIIKYINSCSIKDQIILKSPVNDEFLKDLEEFGHDIMYMPIIRNMTEFEQVMKYNINLIACELLFETLEHEFASEEFLQKLADMKILPWINMITLSEAPEHNLSAYLDDNNLIAKGPEDTLHKAQDLGFKMVQTDWPFLIKNNIK